MSARLVPISVGCPRRPLCRGLQRERGSPFLSLHGRGYFLRAGKRKSTEASLGCQPGTAHSVVARGPRPIPAQRQVRAPGTRDHLLVPGPNPKAYIFVLCNGMPAFKRALCVHAHVSLQFRHAVPSATLSSCKAALQLYSCTARRFAEGAMFK